MKLTLKLIAPITVAAATLGVMPAALASPVAATTPATATARTQAGTPATGFQYWGTYNTYNACNAEGRHLWDIGSITHWKCPRYNRGDYFVFELFVMLGHNPGS